MKITYLLTIILFFNSCSNSSIDIIGKESAKDNEFNYKDLYIDVDFTEHSLKSSGDLEEKKKRERRKAYMTFSGLKRGGSFIKIKNNHYYLTIKSGKEIGICPDLFKILSGVVDEFNEQIKKIIEKNPDFDLKKYPINVNNWLLSSSRWEDALCLYKKYCKQ